MNNPVVKRLVSALNDHDLDAVAACFGDDFTSDWPAHPARDFAGRDRVRRNWEVIFTQSPDIIVEITNAVEADDKVWGEWAYTNAGGQDLRGVIIITVRDGFIRHSRFYMEAVDAADAPGPGGPRIAR
ncbi:nuclear transport factor 2 family protein [Catenuloplanes japonicus]|uniref:nuclear transport factor 2 family protein n=1 Tax=Catenuloplanes japonicus TaxID=33876 RepID=UPI000526E7AA|nr:nuclear transport factor 2 family protein [Catenuloplanes japonicus]